VLQVVEVDDEQLVIATVVHVVAHAPDDAVRDAIEQRNPVASGGPRAALELVDGVAGLLAEQLGEIAIVGRREVQREGARPPATTRESASSSSDAAAGDGHPAWRASRDRLPGS